MTNNEIVEIVYRTYNIRKHIVKLIKNSIIDGSCDDLEQYIYLSLLELDNNILNDIYFNNKLMIYIWNLIRNQRNEYKNHEYGKYKINSMENFNDIIDEEEFDYELKVDNKHNWLMNELDKYEFAASGLTSDELRTSACYEIIKLKIRKKYTKAELARHMNCSCSQISLILRYGKQKIKESYDINFNAFVESMGNHYNK
jgi:hypothetical protein